MKTFDKIMMTFVIGLIVFTVWVCVDGARHPCIRTERRHTEREVCTGREDSLHGCSDGHWEKRRVEYQDEVCVEQKP
jgi:hypothetical protein